MAKTELGNKHQCLSCGAKFYDLGKTGITCPKCDEPFVPEVATKATRAPKAQAPETVEAVAEPVVAGEANVEIVSLEEADAQVVDAQDEDLAALKDADVDVDAAADDSTASTEGEVDNTFLETDDDADPNVTDLIGGGISKGDES